MATEVRVMSYVTTDLTNITVETVLGYTLFDTNKGKTIFVLSRTRDSWLKEYTFVNAEYSEKLQLLVQIEGAPEIGVRYPRNKELPESMKWSYLSKLPASLDVREIKDTKHRVNYTDSQINVKREIKDTKYGVNYTDSQIDVGSLLQHTRPCWKKISVYLQTELPGVACLLYGERGSGRTTLLDEVKAELIKNKQKFAYYNIKKCDAVVVENFYFAFCAAINTGIQFLILDNLSNIENWMDALARFNTLFDMEQFKKLHIIATVVPFSTQDLRKAYLKKRLPIILHIPLLKGSLSKRMGKNVATSDNGSDIKRAFTLSKKTVESTVLKLTKHCGSTTRQKECADYLWMLMKRKLRQGVTSSEFQDTITEIFKGLNVADGDIESLKDWFIKTTCSVLPTTYVKPPEGYVEYLSKVGVIRRVNKKVEALDYKLFYQGMLSLMGKPEYKLPDFDISVVKLTGSLREDVARVCCLRGINEVTVIEYKKALLNLVECIVLTDMLFNETDFRTRQLCTVYYGVGTQDFADIIVSNGGRCFIYQVWNYTTKNRRLEEFLESRNTLVKIESKFGRIVERTILYRGKTLPYIRNTCRYMNIDDYLESLEENPAFGSLFA